MNQVSANYQIPSINLKNFLNNSNIKLLETDNFFYYLQLIDEILKDLKTHLINNKNDDNFIEKLQKLLKKRLIEQYLLEKRLKRIHTRFLFKNSTSFSLNPLIKKATLKRALIKANNLKQQKIKSCKYDIYNDPKLLAHIYLNYVPKVISFLGIRNCLPIIDSHIRFNDTNLFGEQYLNIFKNGEFDNIHYDQDIFSIPLIVYLSDVKEKDGPFEFIKNSENKRGGPLISALRDLTSYDSIIELQGKTTFNHDKNLEVLPIELRKSCSFINHHLYQGSKQPQNYKQILGGIGTNFIFHGYNLLHGGGMPLNGSRLSILFNIKFPLKKIINRIY